MTQEAPQRSVAPSLSEGRPDRRRYFDLPELSLTFVGHSRDGIEPTAWSISDRRLDLDRPAFGMMTLVERAALRALCQDVLHTLDASSPAERSFPHPKP